MAASNEDSHYQSGEDKGGLAPHKNSCPHVNHAISIPDNLAAKLQIISLENGNHGKVTCSMENCEHDECWLCLQCHATLCGRYGSEHMIGHYVSTDMQHCMAMGINDLSFWCYKCEDYINHLSVKKVWQFYDVAHCAKFGEPIPAALLQKTTFNKPVLSSMSEIAEDEEQDAQSEQKHDVFDDEKKQETQSHNNVTTDILDELIQRLSVEVRPKMSYMKSALFYHTDCLKHKPGHGSHVERPERCSVSYAMLQHFGILASLIQIEPREASKDELQGSHAKKHVESVWNQTGNGWYDSDTFYNQHSSRAAKLAAAATIDLMAGILQNKYDNGFALVRPPGHHCEHHKAMGFCLFNNAVVAVNCIRKQGLCQKVLIVDWDVHHGNGTQNMFYKDHDVLYFSVHRHDKGYFYPSTGKARETGNGFNINVPLNVYHNGEGFGDKEYLLIWKDVLLPIASEFAPDIILISAGFDACIGDPLGGMKITPPCYGVLTRLLLNVCSKVAIVLEGGYNLQTMPRAICCCNYALLTGPKQQRNDYDVDEFYDEFKSFITDDHPKESSANYGKFHQWFDDYGEELDSDIPSKQKRKARQESAESANYEECKRTIKELLQFQQKHWKAAAENLKKYK